jgi:hypothetical protein
LPYNLKVTRKIRRTDIGDTGHISKRIQQPLTISSLTIFSYFVGRRMENSQTINHNRPTLVGNTYAAGTQCEHPQFKRANIFFARSARSEPSALRLAGTKMVKYAQSAQCAICANLSNDGLA